MDHTVESVTESIARITKLRDEYGRSDLPFEVTVGGPVGSEDDVKRWEAAGVDRLIVAPWRRSPEAVDGLRTFSDLVEAHLHRS